MIPRYEVIESQVWRRDDGATASVYGACPWMSDSERDRWSIHVRGYTIRDNARGTVGLGRVPWTDAIAHAGKLNARQLVVVC